MTASVSGGRTGGQRACVGLLLMTSWACDEVVIGRVADTGGGLGGYAEVTSGTGGASEPSGNAGGSGGVPGVGAAPVADGGMAAAPSGGAAGAGEGGASGAAARGDAAAAGAASQGCPMTNPLPVKPSRLRAMEPFDIEGQLTVSAVQPQYAEPFFAGYSSGQVFSGYTYKSAIGWTRLDEPEAGGHLPNLPVSAMAVRADGQRVPVELLVGFGAGGDDPKIWRSTVGQGWSALLGSPRRPIWSLSVSPWDPTALVTVLAGAQVSATYDGSTWHPHGLLAPGLDLRLEESVSLIREAYLGPDRVRTIWVGTSEGRVFVNRTPDEHVLNWIPRYVAEMPERPVVSLSFDPLNEARLWLTLAGPAPDAVWFSEDGGQSWTARGGCFLPRSAAGASSAVSLSVRPSGEALHALFFAEGEAPRTFWSVNDGENWFPEP